MEQNIASAKLSFYTVIQMCFWNRTNGRALNLRDFVQVSEVNFPVFIYWTVSSGLFLSHPNVEKNNHNSDEKKVIFKKRASFEKQFSKLILPMSLMQKSGVFRTLPKYFYFRCGFCKVHFNIPLVSSLKTYVWTKHCMLNSLQDSKEVLRGVIIFTFQGSFTSLIIVM